MRIFEAVPDDINVADGVSVFQGYDGGIGQETYGMRPEIMANAKPPEVPRSAAPGYASAIAVRIVTIGEEPDITKFPSAFEAAGDAPEVVSLRREIMAIHAANEQTTSATT